MSAETEELVAVFKQILECSVVEHDISKALSLFTDDVIGIGMGEQGVVSSKRDVERIIGSGKGDDLAEKSRIDYENIQVRCYEERYATVCAVVKIKSLVGGKPVESTLGQLMSFRKEAGRWLVYAIQATPLFSEIEEMEAYPIKFAENVLGRYRQQEQIARDAQSDSIGIYRVDFTTGIFEDAVLKSDDLVHTQKGEHYENAMFEAARKYLDEEDRYRFMSKFSLGSIFKAYNSGKTELSLEYQKRCPGKKSLWLESVIRLYADKTDQRLKGYLYVNDIHAEKLRELELLSRAERDALTGLYNRDYTERKISEKLKYAAPLYPGALFMIDLDYFKEINDTCGHQEGDRILRAVAGCVRAVIRKGDIAGRVGGDEFCVYLCGEITPEGVREKAERLCRKIREIHCPAEKGTSCSIGIAFCTDAASTFEDLYRRADNALYEQKRKNRDGYTVGE